MHREIVDEEGLMEFSDTKNSNSFGQIGYFQFTAKKKKIILRILYKAFGLKNIFLSHKITILNRFRKINLITISKFCLQTSFRASNTVRLQSVL